LCTTKAIKTPIKTLKKTIYKNTGCRLKTQVFPAGALINFDFGAALILIAH
jgi:hypothetical protein